jgi:LacI family transcriptional regulator
MIWYHAPVNPILYFHSNEETSAHELLEGVCDMAEHAHIHVQTIDFTPNPRQVAALVKCFHPCGAIVECGGFAAPFPPKICAPLPVVYLDVEPASIPIDAFAIYHESKNAGILAAKELLMTGYHHFAYIDCPIRCRWSDVRRKSFIDEISANGYAATFFQASRKTANDPIAYQDMLRGFVENLPPQSAVFAATDIVSANIITIAQLLGRQIPGDLAVIGVNNSEAICSHTNPTLSSISLDFRGGGMTAAKMLLAAIRDREHFVGERQRTFGTLDVVRRASTRVLRRYDHRVVAALETIRREACTGISATDVAQRHFKCSRQNAERLFKANTRHTIMEEIHRVQLDMSKRLLANRNLKLQDISDFCGFSNPNSLRKFFLRETGMTMSAWRRK